MDAPHVKGLSLISNIDQFTGIFEGQPPIKQALTATIDTCESRPGHFIIIWSLKQGSLGSIPLSPCRCYNKVETGACPLGYSWWQVSPSDSATHNALSQLPGPEGSMGSLSKKKSGCVQHPVYWPPLHLKLKGGWRLGNNQKRNTRWNFAFTSWLLCLCLTC